MPRTRPRTFAAARTMGLALVSALLSALSACAAPPPPPPPAPTPAPVASTALAGPWTPRPDAVRHRYVLATATALTVRRDTVLQQDSLFTTATVAQTLSLGEGNARRFSGTVERWEGRAASGVLPAPAAPPLPFVAVGAPAGAVQLRMPAADGCPAPAATLVLGTRDLWIALPDTVRVGTRWRDTESVTTCRDALPLVVAVERQWSVREVQREGDRAVLTVERRSVSRLQGRGTQFAEPVEASGRGESTLRVVVDAATGVVVRGEGRSRVTLTLKGRLREQTALQVTLVTIAAAP